MTSATQGPGQRGDDGSCREGSPAGGPGGKHATSLGPRCGKTQTTTTKTTTTGDVCVDRWWETSTDSAVMC